MVVVRLFGSPDSQFANENGSGVDEPVAITHVNPSAGSLDPGGWYPPIHGPWPFAD